MLKRFDGDRGRILLVDEIGRQSLVFGTPGLAEALVEKGDLMEVAAGQMLIEQGDDDNDLYFVVSGQFAVFVNSKRVATRSAGVSLGEMAVVSPVQRRSATVVAEELSLVLKLTEADFTDIGDRFPNVWRRLAQEMSKRLAQRNALIRTPNEKPRVFVISSAEALPIARTVEDNFAHDPFATIVWAHGVFKVTNYTLSSLEEELEQSDFAVAIAHPDDRTEVRDEEWPTPRDNVVFELGYFMGRLGRDRAILMEPRGAKLKLPSDLAGVTTIPYVFEPGKDAQARLGPACNQLRNHINALGRNI